jgi:hypothetical protein
MFYDPRVGQYRDTNGRFVNRKTIIKLVDNEQSLLKSQLIANSDRFINKQITQAQWQEKHFAIIKESSLRMVTLGAGGKDSLTNKHFGSVGAVLRVERDNLTRFGWDIKNGKLSDKQIRIRAGMYSQTTAKAFYRSELISRNNEGFNLAKRVLDPQAQHCDDCLNLATNWINVSLITPPGSACQCQGNCRCQIIYKKDYRDNLKTLN